MRFSQSIPYLPSVPYCAARVPVRARRPPPPATGDSGVFDLAFAPHVTPRVCAPDRVRGSPASLVAVPASGSVSSGPRVAVERFRQLHKVAAEVKPLALHARAACGRPAGGNWPNSNRNSPWTLHCRPGRVAILPGGVQAGRAHYHPDQYAHMTCAILS